MKVITICIVIAVSFALGAAQTTLKKTTLKLTTVKTTLKSTQKPNVLATTVKPTTFKTTVTPKTTSKTTTRLTTTTLKTTNKPTTPKTATTPTTLKTTTSKTTVKSTTSAPPLSTSRLCVDTNSTASNGIIQPYYNATTGEMRSCLFFIFSPTKNTAQRVQISCSPLNITSGSSIKFYEAIEIENVSECNLGDIVVNADNPVVNTVYNSTTNKMAVMAQFGSKDWFSCKWVIV